MPLGREILAQAQTRLEAAGVVGAARDAERLFLHALTQDAGKPVPRYALPEYLNAPATPEFCAAFERLVAARAARQPVSQITGLRAFWKHDFRVTRDTLDPRPDTETLVQEALEHPFHDLLDLGTGTGAILISLLAERPDARGTGTDISVAALAVARDNAARIGVSAQFIQSDWLASVPGEYDMIVSNPPYIALDEMASLSPEVREWEPRQALTDEGDGLGAYRIIAAGGANRLRPQGRLIVEIGPTQGAAVAAMMRENGLVQVRIITDLDGRDRVVSGLKPA